MIMIMLIVVGMDANYHDYCDREYNHDHDNAQTG